MAIQVMCMYSKLKITSRTLKYKFLYSDGPHSNSKKEKYNVTIKGYIQKFKI